MSSCAVLCCVVSCCLIVYCLSSYWVVLHCVFYVLLHCVVLACTVLYCGMLYLFFSVRLLSVLRGHSVFSSPPQRPMTSDFVGFSIPDFIHYIYFPSSILEKEPVFPLLNAKQGHYWYHFYNVFGMTRSLTGD